MQKKLEQLDRKREEIVCRLAEIDAEVVYKDCGLHLVFSYRVKF